MEGLTGRFGANGRSPCQSVRDFPAIGFWLTRGFTNDLMSRLLDLYDRYLEDASRPYAEVVSRNEHGLRARSGTESATEPWSRCSSRRWPSSANRRSASVRCPVRSACSTPFKPARHRQRPVPKLTDLGLPAEATIDPFNGEPLHVKKLPEGWMVYSVGNNRVDDGGTLDGKTDIGAGPLRPEVSPTKRP